MYLFLIRLPHLPCAHIAEPHKVLSARMISSDCFQVNIQLREVEMAIPLLFCADLNIPILFLLLVRP